MSAPAFGNIYAPAWCGFTPQIPGWCDVDFDFSTDPAITVPAGQSVVGLKVPISNDADVLVREIQVSILPVIGQVLAPSDVRVRIRDGSGRLITSDFVYGVDLGPLVPAQPFCKSSQVLVDVQNLSAQSVAVAVIFKGVKRTPCGDVQADPAMYLPLYERYSRAPQGFEFHDCVFPFEFSAPGGAASSLLRVPLPVDDDADFLWRAILGDWNVPANAFQTVGDVNLTFYDPFGVPLNDRGLTVPWGAPGAGQPREIILGNGGGRGAPQWPEILIPRSGVVSCDIFFSGNGAQTVRFALSGVKLYGGC